jgi:hypothetical protein
VDDDAIRALVMRLARPHSSGGKVIERAAILAEGTDSAEIMAWITAHSGIPEATVATPSRHGLHGSRLGDGGAKPQTSLRFVLPAGALSQRGNAAPPPEPISQAPTSGNLGDRRREPAT